MQNQGLMWDSMWKFSSKLPSFASLQLNLSATETFHAEKTIYHEIAMKSIICSII